MADINFCKHTCPFFDLFKQLLAKIPFKCFLCPRLMTLLDVKMTRSRELGCI